MRPIAIDRGVARQLSHFGWLVLWTAEERVRLGTGCQLGLGASALGWSGSESCRRLVDLMESREVDGKTASGVERIGW